MLKSIDYLWKDRKRYLGMPLSFTKYAMSEDRLFVETGFFTTKTEEVLLYRVRDISLQRKLGQKLFGVGTITVLSSDKTMPELVLKNVKHPETTKELLHESVEKMKIQRRVRIGELTSGGEHGCDSGCDGDDLDDDDLQN